MLSTASRQRWLALYEGVKIGERVVGYAADEWRRITALCYLAIFLTQFNFTAMGLTFDMWHEVAPSHIVGLEHTLTR